MFRNTGIVLCSYRSIGIVGSEWRARLPNRGRTESENVNIGQRWSCLRVACQWLGVVGLGVPGRGRSARKVLLITDLPCGKVRHTIGCACAFPQVIVKCLTPSKSIVHSS